MDDRNNLKRKDLSHGSISLFHHASEIMVKKVIAHHGGKEAKEEEIYMRGLGEDKTGKTVLQ